MQLLHATQLVAVSIMCLTDVRQLASMNKPSNAAVQRNQPIRRAGWLRCFVPVAVLPDDRTALRLGLLSRGAGLSAAVSLHSASLLQSHVELAGEQTCQLVRGRRCR